MAEQLKPCPRGHKASEPHRYGWPETGWRIICFGSNCGWAMSGDSEEQVVRQWNDRTPGPATRVIYDLIDGCLDVAGIAEIHIDESTARAFHDELTPSRP